jgi:hypothetical protein
MLLQLPEHLCSEGMSDLGIDAGVLDVFVAQMIGHVVNPPPGLQEMHGDRVAQRVDRPALNPDFFGIVRKELLDHSPLERAFPAGEQIGFPEESEKFCEVFETMSQIWKRGNKGDVLPRT